MTTPREKPPLKRLTIVTTPHESVMVFSLSGDLDLGTIGLAKAQLHDEIGSGRSRFVFDLDEVVFIDSSGLGFLIGALKTTRERGGNLAISRLNAYMLGIFKILNLHEVLDVHDDVSTAVRALQEISRDTTSPT